jgi:hypothetical protein
MKKNILFIVLFFIGTAYFGQSGVGNLDFESWSSSGPTGFTFNSGVTQQTLNPQSGNRFARITSNGVTFPGIPEGYLSINGNGTNVLAGMPYTNTPVSVSGYIRTNMLSTDTFIISGHLRKNLSTFVGIFRYEITQVQSNWTLINIPINYSSSDNPDTLQLSFIVNKGFISGKAPCSNGSYLEIDNFKLVVNTTTTTTDINEIMLSNVMVYPNPIINSITIQGVDYEKGRVFDYSGKLIKEFTYSEKEIDTSTFVSGIYLLQLFDNKKQVIHNRKIAKN